MTGGAAAGKESWGWTAMRLLGHREVFGLHYECEVSLTYFAMRMLLDTAQEGGAIFQVHIPFSILT